MVEKYIKELLFLNDFLIISGLGGFVCSYSASELSVAKNKITPPSKNIVFNTKLISKNQLLSNHIAQCEILSVEEAEIQIKIFVDCLFESLESKNQFIIEGLGRFYYDSENLLRFEHYSKFNYLIESFGLRDLYFKPIDRSQKNKLIFNPISNKTMAENLQVDKTEEENSQDVLVDTEVDTDEYVEKSKKKSTFIYSFFASIVFVFVVFTTYYLNMDKNTYAVGSFNPMAIFSPDVNSVQDNKLLPSESASESENVSNEIIVNDESEPNYDNVNQQPEYSAPLNEVESNAGMPEVSSTNLSEAVTSKTGRYYIIAGSFKKTSKAIALKEKLIVDGQSAKVISSTNDGDLLRVSISDFETYQEAADKKIELLATYGDQLWVLNY